MKRLLIDTSVWIEFLRGSADPSAARLRQAVRDDTPIVVPGLVRAELLRGVRNEHQARVLAAQLRLYPSAEPEDPGTYENVAALYRSARAQGSTVRSSVDCILAALAAENRDILVHRDRDFAMLADVGSFACEFWG